jgi:hypothetical protein
VLQHRLGDRARAEREAGLDLADGLGLELRAGALDGAWGMIMPTAPVLKTKASRVARALQPVPHAA